jgi:hypothetical protein
MSTPESARPPHRDRSSEIPIDEIEERLHNGADPKRVQKQLVEEFLK